MPTTLTSDRIAANGRETKIDLTGVALLAPATLAVATLVLIPLLLVVRQSFATADMYGGIAGGWTTENYTELMDPAYLRVLTYSMAMAAINATLCMTVGYFTAAYICSREQRQQTLLLILVFVPLWADFLVRTFGWVTFLGSQGPVVATLETIGVNSSAVQLVPSQAATALGLVYNFLPVAIVPIYAAMRAIDPSIHEAAADLGCGWWASQRKILVPLCAPGLVAAGVLTFIPTLGVFVIPVLLGGGKRQLVGNAIVTLYTEFRNQPMGAAASTVLLLLMLCILMASIIGYRTVTRARFDS